MDENLKKAQRNYEKSEKGKARRKKYREKPEVRERERELDRERKDAKREYMREYMRLKRAKLKKEKLLLADVFSKKTLKDVVEEDELR